MSLQLQVFLIDERLQDREALLASLPTGSLWALLRADDDGVRQIESALAGLSGLEAIHLISHGAPGLLQLGGSPVDKAAIEREAAAWARIGSQLGPNGDLLLHGSDLGAGAEGEAFLRALALATGAGVTVLDGSQHWDGASLASLPAPGSNDAAEFQQLADPSDEQPIAGDSGAAAARSLTERLNSGLTSVWAELADRAREPGFLELLSQVYGPTSSDAEAFALAATALASRLRNGDRLGLQVVLASAVELPGAAGAYAAVGDNGDPTIYINGDWLQRASDGQLRMVLLEEIGHGFDTELNGDRDTAGDEGELFANRFSGVQLSPEQLQSIALQSDNQVLVIDGQKVSVELANNSPVLDDAASPSLPSINEKDANPLGVSIADLVVDGSITDPDGSPVEAIALEAVDTSLGTWQYRLNGTSQWLTIRSELINSSTNTLGLLLRPNDAIRL
ncbi:MAG: DUF4347 domain-containing protein, partial [Synechococcaceae cyanobacterium]|nr:DUF4347 domain-containing protein [Synechococcaceae cyanobacterium]